MSGDVYRTKAVGFGSEGGFPPLFISYFNLYAGFLQGGFFCVCLITDFEWATPVTESRPLVCVF